MRRRSGGLLPILVPLLWCVICLLLNPDLSYARCVDYRSALRWDGSISASGMISDVVLSGDYGFLADSEDGLVVIALSDPVSPTIVATLHMPGVAFGLAIEDGKAYLALGDLGFLIADVSDPSLPRVLGSIATPGPAEAVAISGIHAFIADRSGALLVVDVSDPARPLLVARLGLQDAASDVAIEGSHAYLALASSGLATVDISNPGSPSLVTMTPLGGRADALTLSGDLAFVCAGKVCLLDISDPTTPRVLSNVYTPGNASAVALEDAVAYVADDVVGTVTVFGFSSPSSPAITGTVALPGFGTGIAVREGTAYVADLVGLEIYDTRSAYSIGPHGGVDTPGNTVALSISGPRAYLADSDEGVGVVDIASPGDPALIGKCDLPGAATCVASEGNYAYVGAGAFYVVSAMNGASPHVVGSLDEVERAVDIAMQGQYVYIADYNQGLMIVSVANPTAPALIGMLHYSLGQGPHAVAVQGDYAYVGDCCTGIDVVNISDPSVPRALGHEYETGAINGLAVDGSYLYACARDLYVLDVSVPVTPRLVTAVTLPSAASHVWISDGHAYVADHKMGLLVVDVHDPTQPVLMGCMYTIGSALDPVVAGGSVYLACGDAGLVTAPVQCDPASVTAPVADRHPGGSLLCAWPNPARGEATIRLDLPRGGPATVDILDATGRVIRSLTRESDRAGHLDIPWDGCDGLGRRVAGGAYFIRSNACGGTARLILAR